METLSNKFSEHPIVKIVFDKHGEKYQVVQHDDKCGHAFKVMTADARFQETEVGYANCLYGGVGILMLADIRMRENQILVYRRTGLFWKFRKIRRETKNFQQCGLGSKLLECVFAFAEEKGIERIVGTIKKLDYPKNPNLLKWYADMGFTVTMETELSAVVAKISKELDH